MPVWMPPSPVGTNSLLFKISGMNMQSGSSQLFTKLFGGSAYVPTLILARQRTGAAAALTAGGISDGTNQIVLAAQAWATLASGVIVQAPINVTTPLLSATPSLLLATVSTSACTADFYIFGYDIS